MPSITLRHRQPLSADELRTAFSNSKPAVLSDNIPSSSNSASASSNRGPHRAPLAPSAPSTSSTSLSATSVRCLSWSPLGNFLAVADARILRVWLPDRPLLRFSTELKPPVLSAVAAAQVPAPRPGGRAPASAPAPLHLAGTERVAWNPNREAELASVGSDGVVRFWDMRARTPYVGEVKIGGEGFSMSWRAGGEELIVGRKDDTLIAISRKTLSIISEHRQSIQTNQIAFSNSGNELFLTTGDSQVKILDYPSMTTLHTLIPHTSSVTTIAQCPRGRRLAIGGSDALITLWDLGSPDSATSSTSDTHLHCTRGISDLTGPVRSVAFSFDGVYVVAGSDERNDGAPGNVPLNASGGKGDADDVAPVTSGITVYAADSGEAVWTFETSAATPCVEWHPSRYLIAYSGEAGGVKIVGAGAGT